MTIDSQATPLAYTFRELTFCPACALTHTRDGFANAGFPIPADMAEACVVLALANVINGLPADDVPQPRRTFAADMPTHCEACDQALIPAAA